MTILPRCYGALNFFRMPELYRDSNMSFVRNLKKIGFIGVQDNLLRTFRKKLNDPDLKINTLYELECGMPTTLSFQK